MYRLVTDLRKCSLKKSVDWKRINHLRTTKLFLFWRLFPDKKAILFCAAWHSAVCCNGTLDVCKEQFLHSHSVLPTLHSCKIGLNISASELENGIFFGVIFQLPSNFSPCAKKLAKLVTLFALYHMFYVMKHTHVVLCIVRKTKSWEDRILIK